MRYPTLGEHETLSLASRRLLGEHVGIETIAEWRIGTGPKWDPAAIRGIAVSLSGRIEAGGGQSPDDVEASAANAVYEALREVPAYVLDEQGFWRFLSLAYFWDFIVWRQSGSFDGGNPARFATYIDGKSLHECVPSRMYLRGRISSVGHDGSAATAVSQSTDLWRSHILRVITGYSPKIARALVFRQANARLATDEIREVAKRLNRAQTNLVPMLLTEEEAAALVDEAARGDGSRV